jgi:hypothetical protein
MQGLASEQTRRGRLLLRLYEISTGNTGKHCTRREMLEGSGLNGEEADRCLLYLLGEGLILRRGFSSSLQITHAGVRAAERMLSVDSEVLPPGISEPVVAPKGTERSVFESTRHLQDLLRRALPPRLVTASSSEASDTSDQAEEVKRGMVSFPTPAGAQWSEVKMRFTDGHTLSIKVGGVGGLYNYTNMGMENAHTRKPNLQWELLQNFAERRGILTWESPHADDRNKKRCSRLSEDLRTFFQIESNPIESYQTGWRTLFQLLPDGD